MIEELRKFPIKLWFELISVFMATSTSEQQTSLHLMLTANSEVKA